MKLLPKTLFPIGAVVTAVFALALVSPRTVHALGDEPVLVLNPPNRPVIVEEVPHLASHLVTLTASVTGSTVGNPFLQQNPNGTVSFPNIYVVPAGLSLVITGVDVYPNSNESIWVNIQSYTGGYYGGWSVPGSVTTVLQYPSGIVVAPGVTLAVFGSGTPGSQVTLHGYLTPN
jgi:hypothetical protein